MKEIKAYCKSLIRRLGKNEEGGVTGSAGESYEGNSKVCGQGASEEVVDGLAILTPSLSIQSGSAHQGALVSHYSDVSSSLTSPPPLNTTPKGLAVQIPHQAADSGPPSKDPSTPGSMSIPASSPATTPTAASTAPSSSAQQHYESATLAVSHHCPTALKRHAWSIADFELRALMYNGNISMVYHAVDRHSGITLALKLYKRAKLTVIERHQVAREIKLHINLVHDSIIGMYAAWKDRNYVYLALEWAPGGDVYSYLRSNRGKLAEEVAVPLILEPFLSGLAAIHAQGLIHRDIKPENILLNHAFQIKIADFGLSIDSKNEVANTRLGTIDYLAPEILDCPVKQNPNDNKENPRIGYTNKVDCWSVGVLAYELLSGQPPFASNDPQETLRLIKTKEVDYPLILSSEAVQFIKAALVRDPTRRLTIQQLLEHPWIRRFCRRDRGLTADSRFMRRNSVPLSLNGSKSQSGKPVLGSVAPPAKGTTGQGDTSGVSSAQGPTSPSVYSQPPEDTSVPAAAGSTVAALKKLPTSKSTSGAASAAQGATGGGATAPVKELGQANRALTPKNPAGLRSMESPHFAQARETREGDMDDMEGEGNQQANSQLKASSGSPNEEGFSSAGHKFGAPSPPGGASAGAPGAAGKRPPPQVAQMGRTVKFLSVQPPTTPARPDGFTAPSPPPTMKPVVGANSPNAPPTSIGSANMAVGAPGASGAGTLGFKPASAGGAGVGSSGSQSQGTALRNLSSARKAALLESLTTGLLGHSSSSGGASNPGAVGASAVAGGPEPFRGSPAQSIAFASSPHQPLKSSPSFSALSPTASGLKKMNSLNPYGPGPGSNAGSNDSRASSPRSGSLLAPGQLLLPPIEPCKSLGKVSASWRQDPGQKQSNGMKN